MAKKTIKKISTPRTSEGFDKALNKLASENISTREDAYKFAYLMFESIKMDIEKLDPDDGNPLTQELLKNYKELYNKWEKALKYTKEHYFEPINKN